MLSDISKYRSSVLCDARDGRTPPIGKLPVVDLEDAAQRAAHPEWHDYIRRVYHGGKPGVKYDLNLFNWFYWFAPLRDKVKSLWLCEFLHDHRPEVADGTPWGGSADAWKTGPEHFMRRQGFFVHRRSHSKDPSGHIQERVNSGLIEVQRCGPNTPWQGPKFENGESWFYHTIGSGIFLDTRDLTRPFGVHYRRISAPRCEIIVRDTAKGEGFWPSDLKFQLGNGEHCVSEARVRTLYCSNRPVPLWQGDEGPPGRCGAVKQCEECPTWRAPPLSQSPHPPPPLSPPPILQTHVIALDPPAPALPPPTPPPPSPPSAPPTPPTPPRAPLVAVAPQPQPQQQPSHQQAALGAPLLLGMAALLVVAALGAALRYVVRSRPKPETPTRRRRKKRSRMVPLDEDDGVVLTAADDDEQAAAERKPRMSKGRPPRDDVEL